MPGTMWVVVAGALLSAPPADPIEIHVMPRPAQGPEHELVAGTITRAIDALNTLREGGNNRAARIVVHGGTHVITEPFVIDAALVGEGLDIDAADATTPTISGGRVITGLRQHENGTWRVVIDDVRDGAWWSEELFVDTTPRTRARHPNAGYARVVTAGADNRTSFTFNPTEIPPELVDAQSEVVLLHDWSTSRVRIATVGESTHTITVAHPIGCRAPHYAITNFEPHPRFFIEGSPALVDTPGEWALNRDTGELVYLPMPGELLEDARLVAPHAPALLRITGTINAPVSNVRIRGLRFAYVNWPIPAYGYAEGQASFFEARDDPASEGTRDAVPAAIELSWAHDCRIDACVIESVGGSGMWIGEGCRNCRITDSIVRGTAANGIMIGETAARTANGKPWWQSAPEQVASGNVVRHCHIQQCGRRFFGAVGIWIGLAQRTTIAHTVVRDLPYTGISVGWRWDPTPTPCRENIVEANHIHRVMQTLSDGGGIYTLGRQPGTVLRGNAIHDIRRNAGRAPSNGIFFDQGTMDLVTEDNVFWDIDTTPIRWHWTYGNTVRNNTFVLHEGQRVAHYNRAKAQDISYEGNRTPGKETWSPDRAEAIIHEAGPRSE
ncbi:MAG: right-handed parallel beta-helix repeat-containing protein [Planctomycetota bacterium]